MPHIPLYTPHTEVNVILSRLLSDVQNILGPDLIGFYLEGSLATGDFDEDSDVDFVAVTESEIAPLLFSRLQAMHEQLATSDSRYAVQLEGSYISKTALRRYDPAQSLHPNIERGHGERLKMVRHDEAWNIHRFVLREMGVRLSGPSPQTLIDPIGPADLRRAVSSHLQEWATPILDDPASMNHRGYQSYTVLSLCRILYTLQQGSVASKHLAAQWAQESVGEKWRALIERTWAGRHAPNSQASAEDIQRTLDLIRYVLKADTR